MKPLHLAIGAMMLAGLGVAWAAEQPVPPPQAFTTSLPAVFRPKVRAARTVTLNYSLCPVTGNCRLILQWTRPSNYVATTDRANVTWKQVSPNDTSFHPATRVDSGTADTILITRPASGTKTGTVQLCYTRTGWNGSACNALMSWSVELPVVPVDTASGLKVIGFIIKPDTARITTAAWNTVGVYYMSKDSLFDANQKLLAWTCPAGGAGKCPQQKFCAYARMGDNTIGMTSNSAADLYCRGIFDKLPGHRATYDPAQMAVTQGELPPQILVHIGNDDLGGVFADRVWYGHMALARASTGEWVRPDLSPITFALR